MPSRGGHHSDGCGSGSGVGFVYLRMNHPPVRGYQTIWSGCLPMIAQVEQSDKPPTTFALKGDNDITPSGYT